MAGNRTGSLNVSPPTHFGNYGSSHVHKDQQKNFGFHGLGILGNEEAFANKLAREIVYNFWNSLQVCNLDLDLDLNRLFESISFRGYQDNTRKCILPPKYLPDQHKQLIQKFTSLWAWHVSEAEAFYITLPKAILTKSLKRPYPKDVATLQKPFTLPSGIPASQTVAADLSIQHHDCEESPPSSSLSPRKVLPLRKKKGMPGKSLMQTITPSTSTQEYEVEKILTHRRNGNGSYSWQVKWKGYNETAWLGDKELANCIEILYKYNEANNISVKSINDEIAASKSTQDKNTPKMKRHASSSVSMGESLKALEDLFDLTHLEKEVSNLENSHKAPKPTDYFKNISIPALVEKWGSQVDEM